MDNAQKICNQLWIWYKRCRDTKKDYDAWDQLLDDGIGIVDQYKDNKTDYVFASEMYLLFLNRIVTREGIYKQYEQ